jgi:hypothetical protein
MMLEVRFLGMEIFWADYGSVLACAYFRDSAKAPLRRRNLVLLVPVLFVIGSLSHS